jgi:hypothetical protein
LSFPNILIFTLFKALLAIIKLCPAVWWCDMNTYLVFSALTFRPTSLLVSDRADIQYCEGYGYKCLWLILDIIPAFIWRNWWK